MSPLEIWLLLNDVSPPLFPAAMLFFKVAITREFEANSGIIPRCIPGQDEVPRLRVINEATSGIREGDAIRAP